MFDFPSSPVLDQVYSSGGYSYRFNGYAWVPTTSPSRLTVSDVAPVSPIQGMEWFDSVSAQLFISYFDGNSTQWVPASSLNQAVPLPIASGGTGATTASSALTSLGAAPSGAINDIGRNLLHNSLFNIQQRGAGPWTTNVIGADRWINAFGTTGGSVSVTLVAMTPATAGAFADEAAQYNWQATHTAGTGAGDLFILRQFMENVRRFSGKTVTISFWAWCASGTPKICVELSQIFGNGGSPSTSVISIGVIVVTINTTPTRYSVTVNIPSASGKTFGTNVGTDYMELNFWLSAGSSWNARSGSIGLQSNTFLFWGMQLEFGSVMTPLEKIEYGEDLRRCQRFYSAGNFNIQGYNTAGAPVKGTIGFPVTMRAVPTVATAMGGSSNMGNPPAVIEIYNNGVAIGPVITATGNGYWNGSYTASADL